MKRRRELLLVLKVFGATTLAGALFVLTWWLLHREPDIGPDPSRDEPPPVPSASASAPAFEPARPTQPIPMTPERLK